MKLNEYQEMAKRTMPTPEGCFASGYLYGSKAKCNYGMGISGEAGEVTDVIKKEVFHGHPEDREKVKLELGDVMYYVAGLATMYGWTLEEVATANIMKRNTRYPNGFNSEDSIKRVDEHGV